MHLPSKNLLFSLSFFALSAVFSQQTIAADKPVLKIATEGAFKPWNFTEPSGKLAGFEVDLAEDLCKRMNRTCEIVGQDWDGIIPALNAGKYDAIIAAMSITEERKKVLEFSIPYVTTYHAAMLPKVEGAKLGENGKRYNLSDEKTSAASVKGLREGLKGKTIGVQLASTNGSFLETYLKDDVKITYYKTVEQLNLDLQSGRIDATIADLTVLESELKKPDFAEYEIAGPVLTGGVFGEGVGVGMRKGETELKAPFDAAIAEAVKDGTVKKLSEKWFGVDISPI